MRAIILCAGLGSRMAKLTEEFPKCMVEVHSKRIIDNTIEALIERGINDICILSGYLAEILENYLANKYPSVNFTFIRSTNYDKTNNIYSLWLAREYMGEEFFIIEGDVFCDKELIKEFPTDNNYWMVDDFCKFKEGCRLTVNKDVISEVSIIRDPSIISSDNEYKSCGVLFIKNNRSEFKNLLDKEILAGNVNVYFDNYIGKHLDLFKMKIYHVENKAWFEIDDEQDLEKASKLFAQ